MTAPSPKPAGVIYRFGKKAILRIARITAIGADGTPTKPDAAAFVTLCLAKEVSVGLTNGKVSIENFCTGGNTVDVPDGTAMGELTLGESTWTESDPSLQIMQTAAFSYSQGGTETGGDIWVEVLPIGAKSGGPVFDLVIFVEKWTLKMPSKGVVTADHTLNVYGPPVPSLQA